MSENFPNNRRRHFRLIYPSGHRPVFEVKGHKYTVANLAESGMLLAPSKANPYQYGSVVEGVLRLGSPAEPYPVKGKVVRTGMRGVAVRFEPDFAVPLSAIMAEQQRVIRAGGEV